MSLKLIRYQLPIITIAAKKIRQPSMKYNKEKNYGHV